MKKRISGEIPVDIRYVFVGRIPTADTRNPRNWTVPKPIPKKGHTAKGRKGWRN